MSAVATIADLLDMQVRYAGNTHFQAVRETEIAAAGGTPVALTQDVVYAVARLESDIYRCSPLVTASVSVPAQFLGTPGVWRVTVDLRGTSSRCVSSRFTSEADALAFRDEANAALDRAT